jgi:Protein of unknown function (DUF4239)
MATKSELSGARHADLTGLGAREPRVECMALPKSVESGNLSFSKTGIRWISSSKPINWVMPVEQAATVLAAAHPRAKGNSKVSLFLAGLPLWVAAILLVVLPTIAAMCGPVLMRRRIGLERLISNNDIAGFKFATVGVIYAVLLAFAVIVVWGKFNDAETAVVQEAGASATIYRLTTGPDPEAVATRAALGNYLRLAIDRDWPLMAKGKESREVTQALNALYAAALRLMENGSRPPAIFVEMFKQLDAITQARRTRLHLATGNVPGIVWAGPVLRRITDRGIHVLFRHQEPTGSGHDDRHSVGHRVHGSSCDRVDRSSLHRCRSCRQRAASDRGRGFRAARSDCAEARSQLTGGVGNLACQSLLPDRRRVRPDPKLLTRAGDSTSRLRRVPRLASRGCFLMLRMTVKYAWTRTRRISSRHSAQSRGALRSSAQSHRFSALSHRSQTAGCKRP